MSRINPRSRPVDCSAPRFSGKHERKEDQDNLRRSYSKSKRQPNKTKNKNDTDAEPREIFAPSRRRSDNTSFDMSNRSTPVMPLGGTSTGISYTWVKVRKTPTRKHGTTAATSVEVKSFKTAPAFSRTNHLEFVGSFLKVCLLCACVLSTNQQQAVLGTTTVLQCRTINSTSSCHQLQPRLQ